MIPITDAAIQMLARRGVSLEKMAEMIYELQEPYVPSLTREESMASLLGVVAKREVQYAVITGLTLDEMAERGSLAEPLGSIVREDHHLYGIDSMLALAIVNMYGSIGLSNYGFLAMDREYLFRALKGRQNRVNTFLDDLVAALIAAACARIAHGNRGWSQDPGGQPGADGASRADRQAAGRGELEAGTDPGTGTGPGAGGGTE